MALTPAEKELIEATALETAKQTLKLPRKNNIQEKLLTSAITLVGLFVTAVIISGLCYCIAFLWHNTLHM